jgi:transposase-like protein
MATEFSLRQQAIRRRLAGQTVSSICQRIGRSRTWFYRWWHRYQEEGADGLREHPRVPQRSPTQVSASIRQAILVIRDRLIRRRGAQARYRLAGAPTIQHELAVLEYTPLPSVRTIERILQQAGRTRPSFRLQPTATASTYPGPQATASNQVHQLDMIGPRYLRGSHIRYYFLVYKDAYDQSPYVEFHRAPTMDIVLDFVVHAWQILGLPRYLQVDNGHLFAGTGRWPGSLNRFIRLVLLVGVELVFIPEGEPFRNGSVENFNGWFQERLWALRFQRPVQVRRELQVLMEICQQEHIHPHLGFQTAAQVRRTLRPRLLPNHFEAHRESMAIAVGKITFLRKVRISGQITTLGVKVKVGKRWRGRYVKATLYTRTAILKIYHGRKLIKEVDFPIRG